MNITDNLIRIKEGKDDIIKSLQNKGSDISNDILINQISTYVDKLEIGGGGDTPSVPTELVPKYEGASVFRINVPNDNYEFAINLCNDATKATYDVDWGDGSLESGLTTDEQHHTYSKSGTYDVNVYNISKDITLGGSYSVSSDSNNKTTIKYLFNNTNNDIWNGYQYNYIEDDIVNNVLIGDKITSIGNYAFYQCYSLQSVELPNSVTSIGQYAFNTCSSLQSVELPNSVTSIGNYTFQNCNSLTSITIPESVKSIGQNAFYACSSLQSVELPNSVTSISSSTFERCSRLQNITIPNSVTSIGSSAFDNCKSLTSITIPESVKSIGQNAFYACSSLQSVELPNSVTSISSYAFESCISLQSIVIPESVTSIGTYVFNNCSSLQNITIPESVTSIGTYAFYNCNFLQSITCKSLTSPTIQSSSFSTSGFKYSKSYLYVPKESVGYDSGNWKTYFIDKGWELRYIEDRIKTPTTLKLKTKNNFFHNLQAIGQANLVDYELIDNEYIYHFDDKIIELVQYTFYNTVLESIELPEGLEIIGKNTFINSSLQSVDIPNSVTLISSNAFDNCKSLTSITIPEGVTSINSSAFSGCYYLKSIECKAMIAPTIQSNTFSSVGVNVPYDTKILRIPINSSGYEETTSEWYKQLISKGYKVEYITQPNNEIWYTSVDGNIVEPKNLPTDNTLLSNTYENGKGVMVFEKDLTELRPTTFQSSNIETVTLPNSISKISNYVFSYSSLKEIVLPNNLTELGTSTFQSCTRLDTITLPSTLKKINNYCFKDCTALTSLNIPNNMEYIGFEAFINCTNMNTIICDGSKPDRIDNTLFTNVGVDVSSDTPKILYVNVWAGEDWNDWLELLGEGWTIEYI